MGKRRQSSCQRRRQSSCGRTCIRRVEVRSRRRRSPIVAALLTVALFSIVGC